MEYTKDETAFIINKYLKQYEVETTDEVIKNITKKVDSVPREIHNLCIKIRDYVITRTQNKRLTEELRESFLAHSQIEEG
jgi:Holliday junction resolvasome RuvABC ATP-dependent DNA helicase subunit